ncbi:uncharacterized protein ZBAI_02080 [Zygosaccharomyces bailii ISA1307]|nr:uncharacterized protein ZBAI_02080 [Zygosaccharomyces bailii ISA1307]
MDDATFSDRLLIKIKRVSKLFFAVLVFFLTCFCITITQLSILLFYRSSPAKLKYFMDLTKEGFISLLITILRVIAPSSVRITTDSNSIPKGTFFKDLKTGRISSHLSSKSVIIANHQIYTDWVFLWWLTSTADLAGRVYIMLKKSLESLPVLAFGMKNYKFIFMSRKWELDRLTLHNSLGAIDANSRGVGPASDAPPLKEDSNGEIHWDTKNTNDREKYWPYTLILFPEGTNMSPNTRQRSAKFASKIGKTPFENVLLPHVTGLRYSLMQLKPSLDVLYDVTIGYSGVGKEEYGEAIYRLPNVIFRGQSPRLVDMYIRAYKLDEIPLDNEEDFSDWLYEVWKEKDQLLNTYYAKGSFGLDPEPDHTVIGAFKMSTFPFFFSFFFPGLLFSILGGLVWYCRR